MTLKQKFSELLPFYNMNDNNNKSIQCEKIADDYAIEFAEWIETSEWNIKYWRQNNNTKELLQMFKKSIF